MRSFVIIAGAAALACLATPAAAQVAGGLTGQVGGQVGLPLPQTAPVTGQAGSMMRDTRNATRETVRDAGRVARSTASDAAQAAAVSGSASGQAGADQNGASAGLNISIGAAVHGAHGANLGRITRLMRDSAGRVESVLVRGSDGVVHSVPTEGASVQGGAMVTGWSRADFDHLPAVQQ